MMQREKMKFARLVFPDETTGKTEFQKPKLEYYPKTVHVEKKVRARPAYEPVKWIESMTEWKPGPNDLPVPFSLYIRPNPILGVDPRTPQKHHEKMPDLDREKVQKTRPRLVMTPAVSLDDIEDPTKRDVIINGIYESTLMNAQRTNSFSLDKNVKSPLGDTYAPPKPIDLPKLKPLYVSDEWKMESVSWDGRQTRAHVDYTKEFWLRRPLK